MFEIIPAIDILGGKCVRLSQGEFNRVKVYSEDPADIAKTFEQFGVSRIHVIDLDGAKSGKIRNLDSIKKIIANISIPIEFGGGVRTIGDVKTLIDAGVDRVILGTSAIKEPALVEALAKKYKGRVVVSIDTKEQQVAIEGWKKLSIKDTLTFAKELKAAGIKRIVFTDIARDGMLKGPNFAAIEEMVRETKISVIASGGITSLDDIKRLKKIKKVEGCIIGKALYEGRINLEEALKL